MSSPTCWPWRKIKQVDHVYTNILTKYDRRKDRLRIKKSKISLQIHQKYSSATGEQSEQRIVHECFVRSQEKILENKICSVKYKGLYFANVYKNEDPTFKLNLIFILRSAVVQENISFILLSSINRKTFPFFHLKSTRLGFK